MNKSLFILKSVSPFDSKVSEFIDELDSYQSSLYPAESNHLDSRDTLSAANSKLVGAYKNNTLVGIGAAKICENYGELKRFYIPEIYRGLGIAELIIVDLEKWLIENRIYLSRLETGVLQLAAIRFYQKLGYAPIAPFGNYKPDPLSLFMEKKLKWERPVKSFVREQTQEIP